MAYVPGTDGDKARGYEGVLLHLMKVDQILCDMDSPQQLQKALSMKGIRSVY